MLAKNRLNQTARRFILAYLVLMLTLLVGLVEVTLLILTGADPMTAVSTPWKLLAFNLLIVLAFVGRYLRPCLLTPSELTPQPQRELNPIEIERERIERWAKRVW
ncbi:MAG: hypothetical protein H6667_10185 [Ardenticatenaceae bacterium]|nr:hypothetical protein [Ardenticatenaceae bacterium]MCB9445844.1 hypothetical protein [Ardenticatenaceae bacterium]